MLSFWCQHFHYSTPERAPLILKCFRNRSKEPGDFILDFQSNDDLDHIKWHKSGAI